MATIQTLYSKISYQNFPVPINNYTAHSISSLACRWPTVRSVQASWEQSSDNCSEMYKELLAIVIAADRIVG